MRYEQKEIDNFIAYIVNKVEEQNKDIQKRIEQFHEQRCTNRGGDCTRTFVKLLHEAINDELLMRVISNKLENKPPLFIFPTNLQPDEKKEEKGGTGFYL